MAFGKGIPTRLLYLLNLVQKVEENCTASHASRFPLTLFSFFALEGKFERNTSPFASPCEG